MLRVLVGEVVVLPLLRSAVSSVASPREIASLLSASIAEDSLSARPFDWRDEDVANVLVEDFPPPLGGEEL